MKIDINGYDVPDIVSALEAACVDAEQLLNSQEFMAKHEYLKPAINHQLEACRKLQDQINNSMASELPGKRTNVKW